MERKREPGSFVVVYNSNPLLIDDNHNSNIILLTDVDSRSFDDQSEAIVFLSKCTLPITTIEMLVPELEGMKKFNYLLSEHNVRPKHQLSSMLDTFLYEEEWEEMIYYED